MCATRPKFNRLGKQSFPTPDHSNFPVHALVARYTLNLLSRSPWHSEFMELLFAYAGVSGVAKSAAGAFAGILPKNECEKILKTDELNGIIIRLIEGKSSVRHDKAFRKSLLDTHS